MQRRHLLSRLPAFGALGASGALGTLLLASGCGFRLRGVPNFAFRSLYVNIPESSSLGSELKRSLSTNQNLRIVTDPQLMLQADAILDSLVDRREKIVVATNAAGQVREFQLRLRFTFRLRTPQGKELMPETELLQQRDISFTESAALAKETEEALLYRDMQTDIVQQVMRRLASVTSL
jgi:LPS-assembly lipoprotein